MSRKRGVSVFSKLVRVEVSGHDHIRAIIYCVQQGCKVVFVVGQINNQTSVNHLPRICLCRREREHALEDRRMSYELGAVHAKERILDAEYDVAIVNVELVMLL